MSATRRVVRHTIAVPPPVVDDPSKMMTITPQTPRRSRLPWIILACVILLGAGAAAVFLPMGGDRSKLRRNAVAGLASAAGDAVQVVPAADPAATAGQPDVLTAWYQARIAPLVTAVNEKARLQDAAIAELRRQNEAQAREIEFLQAPYGVPNWAWLASGCLLSLVAIALALRRRP